jgi:hypothetical protein
MGWDWTSLSSSNALDLYLVDAQSKSHLGQPTVDWGFSCDFTQALQENAGIVCQLDHNCFFPNPF